MSNKWKDLDSPICVLLAPSQSLCSMTSSSSKIIIYCPRVLSRTSAAQHRRSLPGRTCLSWSQGGKVLSNSPGVLALASSVVLLPGLWLQMLPSYTLSNYWSHFTTISPAYSPFLSKISSPVSWSQNPPPLPIKQLPALCAQWHHLSCQCLVIEAPMLVYQHYCPCFELVSLFLYTRYQDSLWTFQSSL